MQYFRAGGPCWSSYPDSTFCLDSTLKHETAFIRAVELWGLELGLDKKNMVQICFFNFSFKVLNTPIFFSKFVVKFPKYLCNLNLMTYMPSKLNVNAIRFYYVRTGGQILTVRYSDSAYNDFQY